MHASPCLPPRPPQMHVVFSRHRNLTIRPGERSRDFTVPAPGPAPLAPNALPPPGQSPPRAAGGGPPRGAGVGPAQQPGGYQPVQVTLVDPNFTVTGAARSAWLCVGQLGWARRDAAA